jgi:L-fucono-1,5-lactonase
MRPRRVDSHQHFWRYEPAEYDWIDARMGAIKRDFLPDDLKREMDPVGFTGSVLIQVQQTLDETRWLLQLADEHPFVLGVVGWVDLRSPDVARDLAEIAQHPKLVGVRHIVQSEPEGFLADDAFLRGIAELDRFGLTYDILVYERHLPEVIEFVSRFPHQRFVLDHLGKPDLRRGSLRDWRWQLRALARFRHVMCKLSGLVTEADWASWSPDQLRPYLETAVECFGKDRVMIGSDWPVCTLAATYGQAMGQVLDLVADWSSPERDAVLGGNAAKFWRFE